MVLDSLQNIRSALQMIQERTKPIKCSDDFVTSPSGTLRLDAVCMNLIALGKLSKDLTR